MAKNKQKLPKFVVVENGNWFVVRRFSPTHNERYKGGRKKYVQIKRRCFPETEDQAEYISQQIEAQVHNIRRKSAEPDTLETFLSNFLTQKQKTVRRRTIEGYQYLFDRHIKNSNFGSIPVADIKPMDVQKFYTSRTADGISPDAVRKIHVLLSMAFNQGIVWEVLTRNPTKGALLPKRKQNEVVVMNPNEAKRFMSVCLAAVEHTPLAFALETGMRPEEYLALQWKDIDLKKRTVRVRRIISWGLKGGGYEFEEPKTKGSRRIVEISGQMAKALQRHKDHQAVTIKELEAKAALPIMLIGSESDGVNVQKRQRRRHIALQTIRNYHDLSLVFPSTEGTAMLLNNFRNRNFAKAITASNIDSSFTIYGLRHTCATLMIAAGINIKVVSEKLGHADTTMVLRTYAHVIPEMRTDAVSKMAGMLYSDAE